MRAYVINLARSPERRAHIRAELDRVGIDYEFIEAVDGRDIDVRDPQIIDPEVLDTTWFRAGVAGCAFSHLRIYKKILEDGQESALVLEDDVTLPADLIDLADSLTDHLTGAEVALLNYDCIDAIKMSRESSARLPSGRDLLLLIDVHQPRSSAAYIVTQSACKRMIDYAVPFKARPDNWGHFYSAGALDRVRCVVAMPVVKDPDFESTIDYNSESSLKALILKVILRYNIEMVKRAIARRRERIWRSQTRVDVVVAPFVNKSSRLD